MPRNEKYFNQTEQTVRANYIVTANIESLSRGIEQYYWFVVKWRNGDGMAMFTSDDSGPYADYSAYSNMTYTMGTPPGNGERNNGYGAAVMFLKIKTAETMLCSLGYKRVAVCAQNG